MDQAITTPVRRTKSRMLIFISATGSFVFHPLLMSAFGTSILYRSDREQFLHMSRNAQHWAVSLLVGTVLLPLFSILVLKLSGLISDARMHHPKDRVLPLATTWLCYTLTYWIFANQYDAPLLVRSLLLGSCMAIVLILVINFFYKISVHTTAAAVLPVISAIFSWRYQGDVAVFVLMCLIALFVGVIRWLLGAHSLGQILLGYVIGGLCQPAAYFVLSNAKF